MFAISSKSSSSEPPSAKMSISPSRGWTTAISALVFIISLSSSEFYASGTGWLNLLAKDLSNPVAAFFPFLALLPFEILEPTLALLGFDVLLNRVSLKVKGLR